MPWFYMNFYSSEKYGLLLEECDLITTRISSAGGPSKFHIFSVLWTHHGLILIHSCFVQCMATIETCRSKT